MKTCRTWPAAGAAAFVVLATALLLRAGPLSPPSGPVASTYKTLSEVEPRIAVNAANTPGDSSSLFNITQPGSYYLTGNILANNSGLIAISINADNVTLDLSGFGVLGDASTGIRAGINVRSTPTAHTNIRVRNGIVRGWVTAVQVSPSTAGDVSDLVISDCSNGVLLGAGSVARDCLVTGQSGGGNVSFVGGTDCVFTRCTSRQGGAAFVAGDRCALTSCSAAGAANLGYQGGNNVAFHGCVAESCTGDGFSLGSGAHLDTCESIGNTGNGFSGASGTLAGCVARSNGGQGFNFTVQLAQFTLCTATENTGNGFNLVQSATLVNCISSNNGGSGAIAGLRASITGCTATANAGGGFIVADQSLVQNCTADFNGSSGTGYGIAVSGTGGRIDSNTCSGNQSGGIRLTGSFNMVVRNTCRSVAGQAPTNNFIVGVGNDFGPIVTVTSATSNTGVGDISGTTGSSHPWANFSY